MAVCSSRSTDYLRESSLLLFVDFSVENVSPEFGENLMASYCLHAESDRIIDGIQFVLCQPVGGKRMLMIDDDVDD